MGSFLSVSSPCDKSEDSCFLSKILSCTTALPPDVRWRLCPTVSGFLLFPGLRPTPSGGIAPQSKSEPAGGAEPPPHISRQSRSTSYWLRAAPRRAFVVKIKLTTKALRTQRINH